jgi:hypothetical protein
LSLSKSLSQSQSLSLFLARKAAAGKKQEAIANRLEERRKSFVGTDEAALLGDDGHGGSDLFQARA